MSLNNFELNLMKYIQECNVLNLNFAQNKFLKTINSLKRNIYNINSYLPLEKKFVILDNKIYSKINYNDFLLFLKKLELKDYQPLKEERISLIIVQSFFNSILNKTEVYNEIGISLSTLKKDTLEVKNILEKNQLKMLIKPKKGISIEGNELSFRLLVCENLLNLTDIEENNLISRGSNTPLENFIAALALKNINSFIKDAFLILDNILINSKTKISFTSKRFFIIYIALTLYRQNKNKIIENTKILNLNYFYFEIFNNINENIALSYLFLSLDFTCKSFTCVDKNILELSNFLLVELQNKIITKIQFNNEFKYEMYEFLYKNIIRSYLGYELYDTKLDNTETILNNLYNILKQLLKIVAKKYSITFSFSQIATLTIITKKYITKSKIVGRNKKKILIISNSSIEKLEFFVERLKLYLEVEVVGYLTIEELDKISLFKFDTIITFSNRIKLILENKGLSSLKLSFYLENNHIENLLKLGFSRTNRKILTKTIAEKLENKSANEIENILKKYYPDIFI